MTCVVSQRVKVCLACRMNRNLYRFAHKAIVGQIPHDVDTARSGRLFLNGKVDFIAEALDFLPNETVIDGELVALGPDGKPNFNLHCR
jgi:hypothetical protein